MLISKNNHLRKKFGNDSFFLFEKYAHDPFRFIFYMYEFLSYLLEFLLSLPNKLFLSLFSHLFILFILFIFFLFIGLIKSILFFPLSFQISPIITVIVGLAPILGVKRLPLLSLIIWIVFIVRSACFLLGKLFKFAF